MAKTKVSVDGEDGAVSLTTPTKRKPAAKKAKTEKKETGRVTKRRSPRKSTIILDYSTNDGSSMDGSSADGSDGTSPTVQVTSDQVSAQPGPSLNLSESTLDTNANNNLESNADSSSDGDDEGAGPSTGTPVKRKAPVKKKPQPAKQKPGRVTKRGAPGDSPNKCTCKHSSLWNHYQEMLADASTADIISINMEFAKIMDRYFKNKKKNNE